MLPDNDILQHVRGKPVEYGLAILRDYRPPSLPSAAATAATTAPRSPPILAGSHSTARAPTPPPPPPPDTPSQSLREDWQARIESLYELIGEAKTAADGSTKSPLLPIQAMPMSDMQMSRSSHKPK